MDKGKIIFLNGVSSSGKTTMAKTLQERLDEPYFWIAHDSLVDMVPKKFEEIDFTGTAKKILFTFPHIIKLFSDRGINVIVDHLFVMPEVRQEEMTDEMWEQTLALNNYDEFFSTLYDYPLLFVNVTCPAEELYRREKERKDRPNGLGVSQLPFLYPQDTYDITIDTYIDTKEDCADKIIELLKYPENFTAFKEVWLKRQGASK